MNKILFCVLVLLHSLHADSSRQKRFLVAPPTSPTRHQLISGIGIPLQLEDESITLGIVFKAQYFLAETVDHLKFNFFPDIYGINNIPSNFDKVEHRFPNGRRRRREIFTDPLNGQKYESYDVNVEQIGDVPLNSTLPKGDNDAIMDDDDDEFDDQFEEDILERKMLAELSQQQQHQPADESDDVDLSSSRWGAYDALGLLLERKGFNGHACVLRAICEAAEAPFSEHLMAELFHIFFTPSTTSEPVSKPSDYDYIEAELIGRDNTRAECEEVFQHCERSILEIFTEIYDNKMFEFV